MNETFVKSNSKHRPVEKGDSIILTVYYGDTQPSGMPFAQAKFTVVATVLNVYQGAEDGTPIAGARVRYEWAGRTVERNVESCYSYTLYWSHGRLVDDSGPQPSELTDYQKEEPV